MERISSIESTFPLRAITKSRVSSPWIPAVAASYGYCHTSSIFRLIDAKYEMYWTSGAFNGVSRNPPPPSSVIPTFPVVAPPVPTAFPLAAPCPRPPDGSSSAITIFPREGVRSFSDFDGADRGEPLFPDVAREAASPGARPGFRGGRGERLLRRQVRPDGQVRDPAFQHARRRRFLSRFPGRLRTDRRRRAPLEEPGLRGEEVRGAGNIGEVDLHDLLRTVDRGGEPVHQPEDEQVEKHGYARAGEEQPAGWHSV